MALLSFGGWLLHARIHPIQLSPDFPQNPANYLPFIIGLVNILCVPFLLSFARTFVVGYLINDCVKIFFPVRDYLEAVGSLGNGKCHVESRNQAELTVICEVGG